MPDGLDEALALLLGVVLAWVWIVWALGFI